MVDEILTFEVDQPNSSNVDHSLNKNKWNLFILIHVGSKIYGGKTTINTPNKFHFEVGIWERALRKNLEVWLRKISEEQSTEENAGAVWWKRRSSLIKTQEQSDIFDSHSQFLNSLNFGWISLNKGAVKISEFGYTGVLWQQASLKLL